MLEMSQLRLISESMYLLEKEIICLDSQRKMKYKTLRENRNETNTNKEFLIYCEHTRVKCNYSSFVFRRLLVIEVEVFLIAIIYEIAMHFWAKCSILFDSVAGIRVSRYYEENFHEILGKACNMQYSYRTCPVSRILSQGDNLISYELDDNEYWTKPSSIRGV